MAKAILATAVLFAACMTAHPTLAQTRERSGEEVVKQQCIKCHGTGQNGAPKIDDRAAWAPRMRNGVQATVASAIKGHGKMPARGGLADLTDTEVRAAILYMLYPAGAALQALPAASPAVEDPHRKVAGGMEVFLGVLPAGKGSYHLNITLRDAASKAPITDAAVEARVANTFGGATKKLEMKTFEGGAGYVNDFQMQGRDPYVITAQIRRKGDPGGTQVQFEFRP